MQVVQGPVGVVGVAAVFMRRRIVVSPPFVVWPVIKQHCDRSHQCLQYVTDKDFVQDSLGCGSWELNASPVETCNIDVYTDRGRSTCGNERPRVMNAELEDLSYIAVVVASAFMADNITPST
jgi:hypothetical protein